MTKEEFAKYYTRNKFDSPSQKKHRFCRDWLMMQHRQTRFPFTDLPHWQTQLILEAMPETIKLDVQGGPSIWAVYPRRQVTKQGRRGQSSQYARNSGHRMRHVAREIFASGSDVHRLSELFQLYTWFILESHALHPKRQKLPMWSCDMDMCNHITVWKRPWEGRKCEFGAQF